MSLNEYDGKLWLDIAGAQRKHFSERLLEELLTTLDIISGKLFFVGLISQAISLGDCGNDDHALEYTSAESNLKGLELQLEDSASPF